MNQSRASVDQRPEGASESVLRHVCAVPLTLGRVSLLLQFLFLLQMRKVEMNRYYENNSEFERHGEARDFMLIYICVCVFV